MQRKDLEGRRTESGNINRGKKEEKGKNLSFNVAGEVVCGCSDIHITFLLSIAWNHRHIQRYKNSYEGIHDQN